MNVLPDKTTVRGITISGGGIKIFGGVGRNLVVCVCLLGINYNIKDSNHRIRRLINEYFASNGGRCDYSALNVTTIQKKFLKCLSL